MAAAAEARPLDSPRTALFRAWGGLAALGFCLLALPLATGLGGHGLNHFVDRWDYDALELLAAAGLFLRAGFGTGERLAWGLLGLGVLSFSVGDILFDFVYDGNPPTPSAADGFYLAFYPACYAALVLLERERVSSFNLSVSLDGLIAALTSSAVGAAVVFQIVLDHTSGRALAMIVDLAYPLADIVLLGLVVFVIALSGWRSGRAWWLLAAAFIAITVADSLYLDLSATGAYHEGTLLDALWPAALLLLAASGWQRHERTALVDLEGRLFGAVPIGCGVVALVMLVVDSRLRHLNLLAVVLALGAVLTVFLRTGLSFRENRRLLDKTRQQSLTDPLTELGNRRRLMSDLARALDPAAGEPWLLVILDLNGFKTYNDTFGHPSGDKLLARLAGKLALAAGPRGEAYRLGGDEFCVLAPLDGTDYEVLIDDTTAALYEEGEGFTITAAFGAAALPEDAHEPGDALRIADERLYARKADMTRAHGESYEVLLRALSEREPSLREHVRGVADLSAAVGARLGLGDHELRDLRLAAELHDVGKLAIPDAVLLKPGPLNDEEWGFIYRHTVIGQRILAGVPALGGVGEIVRATHEHWDGTGYVDGKAAEDIPRAARIIAVCDAYAAMTSDRPYRRARSPRAAMAELRRCAGSQFDPEVVREFAALMAEREPQQPAPRLGLAAAPLVGRAGRG